MEEYNYLHLYTGKFWLISADMGYGHQRAIYPLRNLAFNGKVLNANSMPGASEEEKKTWKNYRRVYEFISRAVEIPIAGWLFSKVLDLLLYIPGYPPEKQGQMHMKHVRYLQKYIKKGLCDSLFENTRNPSLPIITSFFATAIALEAQSRNSVYCIICDTDLNRAWVPEDAGSTRIIYFVPGTLSARRLVSYGVPECNIVVSGFPLPTELLGNRNLDVLIRNLSERLLILDREGRFHRIYHNKIKSVLNWEGRNCSQKSGPHRRLTITYVVGGAGAQKRSAEQIIDSMSEMILSGEVFIYLVAGTRSDTRDYFAEVRRKYVPCSENVRVVWAQSNEEYFFKFNEILHTTDILWTKPSELSFYSALGLPIIITRPIGPQERCNRMWLIEKGAGIDFCNDSDINKWISYLLNSGKLAEAAFNGFMNGRKYGTFNIIDFLETGSFVSGNDPFSR